MVSDNTNPLDILKRLDVKQNVTIRVIDEPTGKVVQEHIGHNAATNSLLTGIAHYLMGDGVLNQGSDTLSMWVPQYISLGTMGLTSQDSESYVEDGVTYTVPKDIGYTPNAPANALPKERDDNTLLRFSEYINQTPGFGADGYDSNTNNNREWFGLGYPYTLKPDKLSQDFFDAGHTEYTLSAPPHTKNGDEGFLDIISVTVYPQGIINQDIHDTSVVRSILSKNDYKVTINDNRCILTIPLGATLQGRIAVIYTISSKDAANCELVQAKIDAYGNIQPITLRSKITYRNMVPEIQSEVPNTLDVIFSAFVSTGALNEYRGKNSYIYITEAGLWSKPYYNDSGDNGMLAGYRIMPTDDEVLDIAMTQTFNGDGHTTRFDFDEKAVEIISVTFNAGEVIPYSLDESENQIVFTTAPANDTMISVIYKTDNITGSWKDMSIESNRRKVQKSIIRIGKNQVAQVIWKIQLGGLEQLNGLRYLYPSQYPEEVWDIV